MDYQEKCLEETVKARVLEMQLMQLRFPILQGEFTDAQNELGEYRENKKEKKEQEGARDGKV